MTPLPGEAGRILHELQVHQVELEMQNEELRRVQAELELSQARYFDLYDLAPVGYFTLTEPSLILESNLTAASLLGRAKSKLLGQPFTRFILSEDRDLFFQHRKQLFETGAPRAFEMRLVRQDGSQFWVSAEVTLAHNADGTPVCRATISDATTHKRLAEAALRKSEARYRSYLEVSGQLGWTTDADGMVVEDMPGWRQYTGQSCEEIQGWGWSKALHPDDLERTIEVWRKAVAGKQRYETEYRLRRHDGVYRDFVACGVPTLTGDGSILEWVGTCIDVTERKQAEDNLRRLAQFPEENPNPVMRLALDGTLLYANPPAKALLPGAANPSPPELVAALRALATDAMQHNHVVEAEVQADAHRTFWFAALRPRGEDYVNLYAGDITRRKHAEEGLRASELFSRAALDSLPAHIAVLDPKGNIVRVNNGWRHFAAERGGASEPSLLPGANYLEVCRRAVERGDVLALKALQGIEGVLSGALPAFQLEYPCFSPEYEQWFFMQVERVVNAAGGVIVSHLDISQRKAAEEALRASEQRYRTLFESLQEGFYLAEAICDDQGRLCDAVHREVNPAFERLMRRKREEIVGKRIKELVPSIRPEWFEVFGKVARTGEPVTHSARSEVFGCYFEAYVFRPAPGHFAVLVTDITERKRAEDALLASEARYRTVAEFTYDWEYWRSPENRFLYVSPSCERITGYRSEEFVEDPALYLRIVHADDRERVRAHQREDLSHPGQCELEFRIVRRDGEVRWIAHACQLVSDAQGHLQGRRAANRDITDRKQTEQALRESESFHRQTLESIPGMVFTTRPDGYCDYQSQQWVEFTGVPMSEHLGDGWNKLLHPDDRPRAFAAWQAAVEGRAPYDLEYRVRRHDGEYEWFKVRGRPIRNAADEIVRWFGTVLNIDDLVKAQQALRQNQGDLDRAQAVGQIGSWRLDVRRNILTWSDENHRIFGEPKGTPLTYEAFLSLVHPDDRQYVDTQWQAGLRGEPYDIEHRLVVDGKVKWVRETADLEFDAAGVLLGGFGITQDITARKQAEERLKASLHEKEVLLQEIHHRVKNNLQVISSLINLQTATQDDPALQTSLGDVRDRVRAMALVHEKLYQSGDLARLNFADYATSLLQHLWRAHGSTTDPVRLALALQPVALPVDTAVPCGLILNELASNALKHAFPNQTGGEVTVGLSQDATSREVCLRVSDNGPGLPPNLNWRESRSLGLRLVQMLTQQLHGTVETGPGPGTEFRILFPLPRKS